MKKIELSLLFVIATSLFSCNNAPENITPVSTKTEEIVVEEVPLLNMDSLVSYINETRNAIESATVEPVVISSAGLREKIKQKWERIHFYSIDGQVVRIKTYPHTSISKRTEEFYLNNQELILAVIEDNGEGEKGKSLEQIDKLYYFNNGELIKEVKTDNKAEFAIKSSDAEELISEVNEYLQILSRN